MENFEKVDILGKWLEQDLRDRTGMDFLCLPYADVSEVGLVVFCGCTVIHTASLETRHEFNQFSRKTMVEVAKAVDIFMMGAIELAA